MAALTTASSPVLAIALSTIPAYRSTQKSLSSTTIPEWIHIGDYSFASVIKYGSSQDFTWTSNYGIPFNLALVQETAFLDNNEGPVHIDYLASTAPPLASTR